MPLFLTGMMGSGKSTVGRLLATRMGATWVDLDLRVERLYGVGVAALLHEGQDVFRRAERRALATLVAEPGFAGRAVVVGTGGGTVLDPSNRACMRRVGRIVFLDAPADVLAQRLTADVDALRQRPLLGASSEGLTGRLAALIDARADAYRDCDLRVDAVGTAQQVAARIEAAPWAVPTDDRDAAAASDSEAV